jgi:(p)ppGpp synthase/HD superfamily hydrolase
MKLTPKLNLAIKVAARAHAGQLRKGDGVTPYITHPFGVAVILSGYTENEDVVVAGLLHDTIEDTSYTFEEMGRDFGTAVADIVREVTEVKVKNGAPQGWQERKDAYLAKLEVATDAAMLVSAADKIYNLTSIADDFSIRGEAIWENFFGGRERFFWFNRAAVLILKTRLKNPIISELTAKLDRAESVMNSASVENPLS